MLILQNVRAQRGCLQEKALNKISLGSERQAILIGNSPKSTSAGGSEVARVPAC